MNPDRGYTGFVGLPSFFSRSSRSSAASDSNRGPVAASYWREHGASRDWSCIGPLDRPRLSAPRRAQYFFSGSG